MPPIVGGMALTPETSAALKQALQAVQQECGDDPQYADLVDALHTAEAAIPAEHGHAPEHAPADDGDGADAESPAEDASADELFAHAEKQHKAKSKAKSGNPFADKGDA